MPSKYNNFSWQNYLELSTRQRRKLAFKAHRGDKGAQNALLSYTRSIKTEVNTRLRALEKSNLDYGKVYNQVQYFTQTQYGTNRFASPSALNKDWYDMALQNDIGYKFLNTMTSTREGARLAEKHRLDRLKELDIVPSNIGRRREKEFLRFLGNEEVSASIDEYGTSSEPVQMFYDVYDRDGTEGLKALSYSLTEHMAGRISFDEAMERVGIKVEDYRSGRRTT